MEAAWGPVFVTPEDWRLVPVQREPRVASDQLGDGDPELYPSEVMPDAVVRARGKRQVLTFGAVNVEVVG